MRAYVVLFLFFARQESLAGGHFKVAGNVSSSWNAVRTLFFERWHALKKELWNAMILKMK